MNEDRSTRRWGSETPGRGALQGEALRQRPLGAGGYPETPLDGRVLRGAQGETRVSAEVLPSMVEATHEGIRGYTRGCPRLHMRVPVAAQEGTACRTAWEGGGGREGEEEGVEVQEDLNGLGARS